VFLTGELWWCGAGVLIPATSGGVERVFSKAGRMHDDLKKAVKEKTLHHAMWAGYAP
jgi:hypothetical protein